MTHTLPITKAREDLTTLVENANKKLEEYIITVNGLPAAVLISAAEYQSWKETNEEPFLGKPLTRELTGRFSFRVSVYRIIYKVSKKDRTIDILTIGHRS